MPRKRNSSSIEENIARSEKRWRVSLSEFLKDEFLSEDNRLRVWYPNELQRQDILVELYQDASSETSDVIFSVEKNIYKVHKSILSLRAKELHKIVEDCDPDTPFSIDSMKPEIFKSILDFAYTVKSPEIRNQGFATDLLIAADCYACIHLKLFVESVLVDKFLEAENAAALLLLADSHNCALLKEAAVKLFIAEAETIKRTEGWSEIKQSNRLLEELLDSVMSSKKEKYVLLKEAKLKLFIAEAETIKRTKGWSDIKQSNRLLEEFLDSVMSWKKNKIKCKNVGTLRNELQEANLPIDGSREVLLNRLNEHRQASDSPFPTR